MRINPIPYVPPGMHLTPPPPTHPITTTVPGQPQGFQPTPTPGVALNHPVAKPAPAPPPPAPAAPAPRPAAPPPAAAPPPPPPPPAPAPKPPPVMVGGQPSFPSPITQNSNLPGSSVVNPGANPFANPQIPKAGNVGAMGVRPTAFGGQGSRPFDPQYAQNMATFAGGAFSPNTTQGLFLNPFNANPFQGVQNGQMPPTLLGRAQSNSPFFGQNGFTPQAPSPNIQASLGNAFNPSMGGGGASVGGH